MKSQQQIIYDWYHVNPEATGCIADELAEMGINPYAQRSFNDILRLLNINRR